MKSLVTIFLWVSVIPVSLLFAYSVNLLIVLILQAILGKNTIEVLKYAEIYLLPLTFSFFILRASYSVVPANPYKKWQFIKIFAWILGILTIITAFINPLASVFDTLVRFMFSTLGIVLATLVIKNKVVLDLVRLRDTTLKESGI